MALLSRHGVLSKGLFYTYRLRLIGTGFCIHTPTVIIMPTPTPMEPGISHVTNEDREKWFAEVIHNVKVKQLLHSTGATSSGEAHVVDSAITGNPDPMVLDMHRRLHEYQVKRSLTVFVDRLNESKARVRKIAFDMNGNTIIVWIEINDRDEESLDEIIIAESKANAVLCDDGSPVRFCSTVVEQRDRQSIPPHFIEATSE